MKSDLDKYLSYVEAAVSELKFPSKPASLYDPMRYFLALGGKRIRPVLTLMSAEAFGGNFYAAKNAALAVELFHNFSLIHDDIMDKAPLRRNQPTVHHKWNENIAILSGDAMLIEAYKLLTSYPAEEAKNLLQIFNQTSIEVCEGQQLDMDFETASSVLIADYLEMIRMKTAVLLGCSLKMGSIIARASLSDQDSIYSFGVNLGIAFQLQDDILDLYANQEKFGKQTGGDILSNKKTYLFLKAFEDANPSEKQLLEAMISEANPEKKIALAKEIFSSLKIREKSEQKMEQYYQDAMRCLTGLNLADDQKRPFVNLANYLMNRDH